MKVVVFGITALEAEQQMDKIMENFSFPFGTRQKRDEVIFPNGDVYQSRSLAPNCRAIKCEKVYIQREIRAEDIEELIRPMLIYSYLPADEQIVRY